MNFDQHLSAFVLFFSLNLTAHESTDERYLIFSEFYSPDCSEAALNRHFSFLYDFSLSLSLSLANPSLIIVEKLLVNEFKQEMGHAGITCRGAGGGLSPIQPSCFLLQRQCAGDSVLILP